ncbi:uncharacterized protein LY79DRAFT_8778 [Colletotrichum navitas]|uniref:Uncharacterized protein n=1 Tax=Colletotrichum navitas TaxID=681940 RepID=A0AAD8VCI5_9PEZI|nr:uncharacterized protein LY79DRAFT_8778 [Colletotrichum navitas]KAK1600138.1 hypothetical protein LY79DRAFT_8778 [Colletotrichum navitas]
MRKRGIRSKERTMRVGGVGGKKRRGRERGRGRHGRRSSRLIRKAVQQAAASTGVQGALDRRADQNYGRRPPGVRDCCLIDWPMRERRRQPSGGGVWAFRSREGSDPLSTATLERYVPLSLCLSPFLSLSLSPRSFLPCHLFRCGRRNRTDFVWQLIPGSGRPAVKITAALQQTAGTAGRWTKADHITYILRRYSQRLCDTLALSITLYYTTALARVAALSFSPFTNQGYGVV